MSRPEDTLCVLSLRPRNLSPPSQSRWCTSSSSSSISPNPQANSPPSFRSSAADVHYDDAEARKYTTSSRIQTIQASMTRRALELLDLAAPSLVLDVGCGSGLSGELLSAAGHTWVGMDLSPSMLDVALQRDVEGDLLLADMGQGVPFRPGAFDAAVSISAVQWLCSAETSDTSPAGRLARFFDGLYAALRRGARAVCQFYPKNDAQRNMITQAAVRAGFGAGILEDDPGTKNVKLYLVLTVGSSSSVGTTAAAATTAGTSDITGVVAGMDGVDIVDSRKRGRSAAAGGGGGRGALKKGSKAWIVKKKEQLERKGRVVKATSKYTGRKRRPAF